MSSITGVCVTQTDRLCVCLCLHAIIKVLKEHQLQATVNTSTVNIFSNDIYAVYTAKDCTHVSLCQQKSPNTITKMQLYTTMVYMDHNGPTP